MREVDPDLNELLVRLGDLDETAVTAQQDARERGRTALLQQIAGEPGATRPGRPRMRGAGARRGSRRILLLTSVPLLVLVLGAVGFAAFSTSSSVLSAGVGCHLDHRLDGDVAIFGLDGRAATAICASAWRRGQVVDGVHHAPPLQACVDRGARGPIHVFTGSDPQVCARVKLTADPTAGVDPAARRYAAFEHDLVSRFVDRRCVTVAKARQLARAALARHRLGGTWRVLAGSFSTARPCATLAFDSDARVVSLVPGER